MGLRSMNFKRKKKETVNKKVRNAKKVIHTSEDGVETKLDSGLELFFYTQCLNKGIKVEREPKFVLQPKFTYLNQSVREITMFPDFLLPELNIVVETKGFETDTYKIKKKMIIYHLSLLNKNTKYVILKNKKEITEFINSL